MSKCQKTIAEISKMSKKKLKCQHTSGNVYEMQCGKGFKMINDK